MDTLDRRKRLFVEAYSGDIVEAMQVAGFVGQPDELNKKGEKLLKNPTVIIAIKERSKYLTKTNKAIADRQERQQLWTSIMRNDDPYHIPEVTEDGAVKPRQNIPLQHRLKATEQLAKSEGDFIEQLKVTGNLTVTDIITKAYEISDDELDAIEAEYEEIYNAESLSGTETSEESETQTQEEESQSQAQEESNESDDSQGLAAFL